MQSKKGDQDNFTIVVGGNLGQKLAQGLQRKFLYFRETFIGRCILHKEHLSCHVYTCSDCTDCHLVKSKMHLDKNAKSCNSQRIFLEWITLH